MLKMIPLVLKNMLRSRTRLIATVGGCAIAAFIVCFFLASQQSLNSILSSAASMSNVVVSERDKF